VLTISNYKNNNKTFRKFSENLTPTIEQHSICEIYFEKYKKLPNINNIFLIELFAVLKQGSLNTANRFDNFSFRDKIMEKFAHDCSISLELTQDKAAISNILIYLCQRYIATEVLDHTLIINWKVNNIKNEDRKSIVKTFINWYAGKVIHSI
jgi:hypothetical protein